MKVPAVLIAAIIIFIAMDVSITLWSMNRRHELKADNTSLRARNAELTTALSECRYQAERMQAAVELRDMTNNNAALDKLIEANR